MSDQRFNTGNPIGSNSPLDRSDNTRNLDVAVLSDEDTFQDRLGKSRLTWTGIVKAGSGDPAIAVDAAARAETAADNAVDDAARAEAAASQVQQDADQIAADAAQQAADNVVNAVDGAVDRAESAADAAQAAADAAFINADVYPDVASGLAAVADGEQFQVVEGDEVVRYRRDSASTQTEVARYPSAAAVTPQIKKIEYLEKFSSSLRINEFVEGSFSDVENLPVIRSGSVVVPLTEAQGPLAAMGYSRGIRWRMGNDFVKYETGADVRGKWITAGFLMWSSDRADVESVPGTTIYGADGNAIINPEASTGDFGFVDYGEVRLVWGSRRMQPGHATPITAVWIGSAAAPATSGRYATAFFAQVSDAQGQPDALLYEIMERARVNEMFEIPAPTPHPDPEKEGALTLTLPGEGDGKGYIESAHLLRGFTPFPTKKQTASPVRFNMRDDSIEGVLVRDGTDDIAPDHIDGATVGANHGYNAGQATANGHGKTNADCGSVWANGGSTFVLAAVLSANTLLLVREGTNTPPSAGTYTHVSGAINTSNIVATSVSSTQWYPPHRDYQIRVYADGEEVLEKATQLTADKVQFVESANLIARADILDAWKADGGMPAGWEPDAVPSVAQTLTYTYDKRGQLTIARDWLTLKAITVTDYMGLQLGRSGPETYIIPGAVPFIYQGETLDYSMGVAADKTLASGVSIDFDSTMLQAEGEYANRLLAVYPNAVFALGFLPVGDAAPDVRRERVSNKALQIRGNSGKVYFRVLDIGVHTSQPGTYYSVIAYRFVLPRSTERTAFYAVEGGGATWVYADWHNMEGLDRLPIDEQYPELIGRSFEVIEARNVTAKGGIIAGPISVIVSAATSSATLILKVT